MLCIGREVSIGSEGAFWGASLPSSVSRCRPLADATVPGGHLWLLDVPLDGGGFDAVTVYAALGQVREESTLVEKVLYGPDARFLVPDLIAHKAYFERRGYEEMKLRLKRQMATMRTATERLLDERAQGVPGDDQVAALARGYDQLASSVPRLSNARIQTVTQLHNFDNASAPLVTARSSPTTGGSW